MATKKKTEETEVKAIDSREAELAKALEEMKKEREALLKENKSLKAETEEYKANDLDLVGEHDEDYWNEYIDYDVPYYGDDEDTVVQVNEERCRVVYGEKVHIKRKFAAVLENQKAQRRYSDKYNRALQDEFENDTKKLGL